METTTLAVGGDIPLELVDGKAPTELRLFRAGENPSKKGTFVFDDHAAMAVMDEYRRMGRDWVTADYDHGQLQEKPVNPSESGKSAGRARLELRNGELWATNIRWTPAAKAAIEAGEWPSISPAFTHGEDGRPTWLINFGLTGNPALHAPAELIAANALHAALAVLSPADEATPEPADASPQIATAAPTTPTTQDPPAASALAATTTNQAGGAAPAITRLYIMTGSTLGQLMAAKGKTAKDLADMLGMDETEALKVMGMPFGSGAEEAKSQYNTMMSAVALSVGLDGGVAQPKLVERLSALSRLEGDVLKVTGAKSTAEALGAISGLVAGEAEAKRAVAELAAVKAERVKGEIEALLSTGKAEKRLTPAEVDDASEHSLRATALSMGDRGAAWLKANIARRPVIEALSTNYTEPTRNPAPDVENNEQVPYAGKKYAELSYVQRDDLSRRDPKRFEQLRTEYLNAKPSGTQFPVQGRSGGSMFSDLPG